MNEPGKVTDPRVHDFWVTEQPKEDVDREGTTDKAVSSYSRDFTQETEEEKAS